MWYVEVLIKTYNEGDWAINDAIIHLLEVVASKKPKPIKTEPLARLKKVTLADLFSQFFIF